MDPSTDQQIIQETLREARLCDALGMEMLWLAEHHFDGICAYVDPVTFAAALAASTKQIRIGFAVAPMSLHPPIRPPAPPCGAPRPSPDPVPSAAALPASTKQIRIGFAVAQMSLHHPIRLAEQM